MTEFHAMSKFIDEHTGSSSEIVPLKRMEHRNPYHSHRFLLKSRNEVSAANQKNNDDVIDVSYTVKNSRKNIIRDIIMVSIVLLMVCISTVSFITARSLEDKKQTLAENISELQSSQKELKKENESLQQNVDSTEKNVKKAKEDISDTEKSLKEYEKKLNELDKTVKKELKK